MKASDCPVILAQTMPSSICITVTQFDTYEWLKGE